MISQSWLQLRGMSESVAPLQSGSVLMSVTPATIEGHADARFGPQPGAMLVSKGHATNGPHQFKWPELPPGDMVTFEPGLLLRVCFYHNWGLC